MALVVATLPATDGCTLAVPLATRCLASPRFERMGRSFVIAAAAAVVVVVVAAAAVGGPSSLLTEAARSVAVVSTRPSCERTYCDVVLRT